MRIEDSCEENIVSRTTLTEMADEEATIEYTESSFHCHEFNHTILSTEVKFEVLQMKDSTFVWIGNMLDPKFSDLSLAIKTPSNPIPIATKILGAATADTTSLGLAERLSKKLKKPVYISFNISIINNKMLEDIERRLVEEIEINAEKF
ncbi:proteasome assembly chaperone 4-like [Planococcus citri]|uniref:proteasome assembly chaperone 4-like n=1 Tax=Planococcus citri TaxID=170843 RepID=UPI0031F9813B